MENKASLVRAMKEQQRLETELQHAIQEVAATKENQEAKLKSEKDKLRKRFEEQKRLLKKEITAKLAEERELIKERLFEGSSDFSEITNILNDETLLEKVYQVISPEQIAAYEPPYTAQIEKDDVEEEIQRLQMRADSVMKSVNLNKLFDYFEKAEFALPSVAQEDEPLEGKKPKLSSKPEKYAMYFVVFFVSFFLLMKASILLLLLYSVYAGYQLHNTVNVVRFLTLYNSLMESTGNGEMPSLQEQEKENVLVQVNAFLSTCETTYFKKIDNIAYTEDKKLLTHIYAEIEADLESKQSAVIRLQMAVEAAADEVMRIKSELERYEKERASKARSIEEKYLNYRNMPWRDSLPEDIYLGKNKRGDAVLFPLIHGNTLFVSDEAENLFSFARLFIMQMLINVHPDYVSQYVLDYKYMAGNLQQYMNIPPRCVSILMEQDKIESRLESLNEDILARNRNILRSVNSLEEFNELMRTYESVGEGYVFVHIFGLQQLTQLYHHFLRNGSKVGYYFYIYMTMEEYKQLKSEEMLDLMSAYFFISDIPGVGVYPDKRLRSVMTSYLMTA